MNSLYCALSYEVPGLDWFADETFFSLCTRFHLLSGNCFPAVTSGQLLGLPARFIKHDLPCGVGEFEHRTSGRWGCADSIITAHTIFPIFAPFQAQATISKALELMKGDHIGSLKYQLGLVTSGFGAEHPLRACPDCMRHDQGSVGVAYWHLSHQYPGSVVCAAHGTVLLESTRNRRWRDRFEWTLPCDQELAYTQHTSPAADAQLRLLGLARASVELAAGGLTRTFDLSVVAEVYRNQLQSPVAGLSLTEHVSVLKGFHPYERLPGCEKDAAGFVALMTRSPRRHYHPLKHLIMITWLFGDLTNFMSRYQATSCSSSDGPQSIDAMPNCSTQVTSRLKPPGSPRPKKLKPTVRSLLIDRLRAGATKQAVCEEFDVTVSTINKILRAKSEVQAEWSRCRLQVLQAYHRAAWAKVCGDFPNEGVKALRARCTASYAWLYRNDRAWLSTQVARIPKAIGKRRVVDWDQRDDDLCRKVSEAVFTRYGTDQGLRLETSQLYLLVPTLPSALQKAQRYPKTRSYLCALRGDSGR